MTNAVLTVDRLTVDIPARHTPLRIVDEVSFVVNDGEIVGIVGESGCGKSTLVKAVLGLTAPGVVARADRVELAGFGDIMGMPRRQLRAARGKVLGYVTQNPFASLNPIYRIDRQFVAALRAHGDRPSKAECRDIAFEKLRAVGIAGPDRVLNGYAHELSGGMAQRVVIALATILNPRLLVADEPTTGLDVTVQKQIMELINGTVRERSCSALLVTHDLGIVAQYCQRVIVMYAGRVVESGPVSEVFGRPCHPYTAALIGSVPQVGRALERLPGGVPDLGNLGEGCSFASRCRLAHDRCSTRPRLRAVTERERLVACHLEEAMEPVVEIEKVSNGVS